MTKVAASATTNNRTAPLFDHLVGGGLQRLRDGHAECVSGLEIDHQFEFGGCLHRKFGGFLALEDAVDVTGRAPVLVDKIRPIGDQGAMLCITENLFVDDRDGSFTTNPVCAQAL